METDEATKKQRERLDFDFFDLKNALHNSLTPSITYSTGLEHQCPAFNGTLNTMPSLNSLLIKCKSVTSRNKKLEKELLRSMRFMKKTMTLQRREPKGIGDIKFTVGLKETKSFQAENESRRAGGDSYFVRVKKVSSTIVQS